MRGSRRAGAAVPLLLAALAAAPATRAASIDELLAEAGRSAAAVPASALELAEAERFYEHRAGAAAWTDGRVVGPAVQEFLRLVESAGDHGLAARTFRPGELEGLVAEARAAPPRSLAWLELDLALTRAALRFGHELAHGRVSPEEAGVRWLLERRSVDVAAALAAGLERAEPAATLLRLAPEHPEYALLQSALARLRAGHAPRLQGVPPGGTDLAELLALNLDRWRWMPDQLAAKHARVNLPAFELQLFEDGARTLRSRVIVGRPDWATPAFTDSLHELMLNPYWNVPDPIARHELLPKLRKDPELLRRRRYTVLDGWRSDAAVVDPSRIDWNRVSAASFPYRLRQEPGAGNALGRLIFMLGNDFEIYLHDTPGRRLFERSNRALSHGCIRVEASRELAERLFAAEDRSAELEAGLGSRRNGLLALAESVPLHVVHFTVEPAGAALRVHEDLYGVDAALAAARRSKDVPARSPVAGQ